MAYGVQTFDSTGRKIFDSQQPVLVLERVHSFTGTARTYYSTGTPFRCTWNQSNPTAGVSPQYYPTYPSVGGYTYNISTNVLGGDPTGQHAVLAFSIPVGQTTFYQGAVAGGDIAHSTSSTLKVAVFKPANYISAPIGDHGAVSYDENGTITWSSNRPVAVIQGPLSMGTFVATNWFVLSNNKRRVISSGTYGNTLSVGVHRTGLTTLQTKVGVGSGFASPSDNWGADSQEATGLVLKSIDNLESLLP